MSTLTTLPSELLEQIEERLPTHEDLACLSQTCRYLYHACERATAYRLLHAYSSTQRLRTRDDIAFLTPQMYEPRRRARIELQTLVGVSRNVFLGGRITKLEIAYADCADLAREMRQVRSSSVEMLVLIHVRVQDVSALSSLIFGHAPSLRSLTAVGIKIVVRDGRTRSWRRMLLIIQDHMHLNRICMTVPHQTLGKWLARTKWEVVLQGYAISTPWQERELYCFGGWVATHTMYTGNFPRRRAPLFDGVIEAKGEVEVKKAIERYLMREQTVGWRVKTLVSRLPSRLKARERLTMFWRASRA